ncbi:MAG: glycosyltransferase [Acidobacteria bacterium]|nr:glycosyltransferase [Acidobacteriota bacterium]
MSILTFSYWILAALTCGSLAYCAIAIFGAIRFLNRRKQSSLAAPLAAFTPPVSLLKPVYGADRELEENLRSFYQQDYPCFEILFSAREESDPAVEIVRRLQAQYPFVPSRLLLIGSPKYLNAKVHGMEAMMEASAHEVLVISDSDVRVAPDYLRSVVAPLSDSRVGMTTVLSRGVPGTTLWSQLETFGMNTQFIPGVLSAWVLLGLKFSLGPTMTVRKTLVEQMGGFTILGDYLADDFILGEQVARMGHRVEISNTIPEHLVYNDSFAHAISHSLRWERSSRRSRPAGYVGQVFMHTLPLAGLTWLVSPPDSLLTAILVMLGLTGRYLLAAITASLVLQDRTFARSSWLLPVQDAVSFLIWLAAFFGKQVEWRGERFTVLPGGKLQRVDYAGRKH